MEIGKIDAKIIIEATHTKLKIVTALVRGHKLEPGLLLGQFILCL